MESLISKNASLLIWQYFEFKAGENGEPRDLNDATCRCCYKPSPNTVGSARVSELTSDNFISYVDNRDMHVSSSQLSN